MAVTRRTFLQGSAAAAVSVAAGLRLKAGAPPAVEPSQAPKPLKILVLGGTGFLGPATIERALARGHQVTMFNRGKTRPTLFPGVEKLLGDRDPDKNGGLKSLEGRAWDVVIDNSAYYPRMVKASAGLLAPRAKHYLIISSISAYTWPNPVNGTEAAPLATMANPALEEMGEQFKNYGALKALCEQAAEAAMPGRVTVVRPGLIVGPEDPTGRFTYWPVRMDRGGEAAVPGTPDDPTQLIDVRDLGAWLIRLAEKGTVGTFNACGPERKLAWGRVIQACLQASPAKTVPVWLPAAFLKRHEEVDFPLWAPPEGESQGFHTWSNARAMAAGLRFRPVEATAKDTLAWFKTQGQEPGGRTTLAGPAPEAEAKLIAEWKAQNKA